MTTTQNITMCFLSWKETLVVPLNSFKFPLLKGGTLKGQIKPKIDWRAVDSPKKRTNEFAFFYMKSCYVVKSNAILLTILSDLYNQLRKPPLIFYVENAIKCAGDGFFPSITWALSLG